MKGKEKMDNEWVELKKKKKEKEVNLSEYELDWYPPVTTRDMREIVNLIENNYLKPYIDLMSSGKSSKETEEILEKDLKLTASDHMFVMGVLARAGRNKTFEELFPQDQKYLRMYLHQVKNRLLP